MSRHTSSRGSRASEKTAVVTVSPPFSSTSHTKQPRYLPFVGDVQQPSWPMTTPPASGRADAQQCAVPSERGIPDGVPAVRGRLAFLHEARKSTIAFSWLIDSDSPNLSGAEWLGLARSGAGRHGGRPCRRPPSLRELAASRAPLHQERPDDYRASFSIFVPSGCAGTCVATIAITFPASTLQTSHGALAHVRYHSFARQSQK